MVDYKELARIPLGILSKAFILLWILPISTIFAIFFMLFGFMFHVASYKEKFMGEFRFAFYLPKYWFKKFIERG